MKEFITKAKELLATYGGKILLAIVVLIVGLIVVRLICKGIAKALEKGKMDETAKKVIQKIIKALLYIILILTVVNILGVPMTSVVTILASCGVAVGLALQGALSNLAGGIMILLFKPFKVGDYVYASDAEGTVEDINIFYTRMVTLDNKMIFVPNGDLMNSNVTNYSYLKVRRVDQDFKITNDIDAEFVKKVLLEAASQTPGVLADPAPFARMTDVDDDTYLFTVRVWCNNPDYWDVRFDLVEGCSKALSDNGIDDPEERIAIRMVSE